MWIRIQFYIISWTTWTSEARGSNIWRKVNVLRGIYPRSRLWNWLMISTLSTQRKWYYYQGDECWGEVPVQVCVQGPWLCPVGIKEIMKYTPLWMLDMLAHLRLIRDCLSFQCTINHTLFFVWQCTNQGSRMCTFTKERYKASVSDSPKLIIMPCCWL